MCKSFCVSLVLVATVVGGCSPPAELADLESAADRYRQQTVADEQEDEDGQGERHWDDRDGSHNEADGRAVSPIDDPTAPSSQQPAAPLSLVNSQRAEPNLGGQAVELPAATDDVQPEQSALNSETATDADGLDPFARHELERLIRRYHRKRQAYLGAEAAYELDRLAQLPKLISLFLHDTPLLFAPLPHRDHYAYDELMEAAEDLLTSLTIYFRDYSGADQDMHVALQSLKSEVERVVKLQPPSRNRTNDFLRIIPGMEQSSLPAALETLMRAAAERSLQPQGERDE